MKIRIHMLVSYLKVVMKDVWGEYWEGLKAANLVA